MRLEEWLGLPEQDLAEIVKSKHLAVLLALDGTQRHFLIHHPELGGKITDFSNYAQESVAAYIRILELFLSHGVETLFVPLLIENDFWRGQSYIQQSVEWCSKTLVESPFSDIYQKYGASVRLYGDYDISDGASFVRPDLTALAAKLEYLTSSNGNVSDASYKSQIWYGIYSDNLALEAAHRSIEFYKQTGRTPNSEKEFINYWFPNGPERLNILINGGWLISGGIVPGVFANQAVDIYNLPYLAFDLQSESLRRILYDSIYLRHITDYDTTEYSVTQVENLANYYKRHSNCVIGLGESIEGFWYGKH